MDYKTQNGLLFFYRLLIRFTFSVMPEIIRIKFIIVLPVFCLAYFPLWHPFLLFPFLPIWNVLWSHFIYYIDLLAITQARYFNSTFSLYILNLLPPTFKWYKISFVRYSNILSFVTCYVLWFIFYKPMIYYSIFVTESNIF